MRHEKENVSLNDRERKRVRVCVRKIGTTGRRGDFGREIFKPKEYTDLISAYYSL